MQKVLGRRQICLFRLHLFHLLSVPPPPPRQRVPSSLSELGVLALALIRAEEALPAAWFETEQRLELRKEERRAENHYARIISKRRFMIAIMPLL
jgi:hypothetical protein